MNEQHNPAYPVDPKRTVAATVMTEDFWDGQHPPGASRRMWPDDHGSGQLAFACPGCCRAGTIQTGQPKPQTTPSWAVVAGTIDDPKTLTLSPSIHCVGCCGWHGYLTNGVYVSC
jgi:hypothetical protein